MAAPKGNQYWKLRSKHGRDRIIKSPEMLAKAADEYFEWCNNNPIFEVDYRGRDLTEISIPHPRPFLKEQFARFCGLTEWKNLKYLEGDKEQGKDFSRVLREVETTIADQKYQYAVVNMFNSNIVARDLGLKDSQGHDHKISDGLKIEFKKFNNEG